MINNFLPQLALAEVDAQQVAPGTAWAIAIDLEIAILRGTFAQGEGHTDGNAPIYWAARTLDQAGFGRQAARLADLHRLATVGA